LVRWARSLKARVALLLIVFCAVPVVLYQVFEQADAKRQAIVLDALRDKGLIIARALSPLLSREDRVPLADLPEAVGRFATADAQIKVLFKPAQAPGGTSSMAGHDVALGPSFYYVAAAPPIAPAELETERRLLVDYGILDQLGASCAGDFPLALPVRRSDGGRAIMTSITPVKTSLGCWGIVIAHGGETAGGLAIDEPYWQSAEVRLAAAIYAALAALVMAMLSDLGLNLARFGREARRVSEQRGRTGAAPLFSERNTIPELDAVAADFDAMVATLARSAENIREAAEENAHAFKTPLAIISQAIEPLKRRIAGDERAARAIAAITASLAKLDGLVASMRKLDRATADLLDPPRQRVELSGLVSRVVADLDRARPLSGPTLVARVKDGIMVLGGTELIEIILENLIENALSFTPEGRQVAVSLERQGTRAVLRVEDEGPGVDPSRIPIIFERYHSDRPALHGGEGGEVHFGIGLWLVRRNAEAMGGSVEAQNRPEGGLAVTVRLPLAN
jgi:two-component system sensor histidine kinase ChvG